VGRTDVVKARRHGGGTEASGMSQGEVTAVLSVETEPSASDVRALEIGLTEHAVPVTGVRGFVPLAVFARAGVRVLGGAYGTTSWNWLHIGLVWVSAELRRQGMGRKIIAAIEGAARERGCTHAHLDTFSFQARPFYERLGYQVFATLDDFPPGHRRFFLRKRIAG
jgi:GNAT superfamily N-acetyltransferase